MFSVIRHIDVGDALPGLGPMLGLGDAILVGGVEFNLMPDGGNELVRQALIKAA